MNAAVSVVGLGKLGLGLAACLASKKIKTVGIDKIMALVEAINRGEVPWYEKKLDSLVSQLGGSLLITDTDIRTAVNETETTFILIDTPSQDDGSFKSENLVSVTKQIGRALKASGKKEHLIVISSTISPGTISNSIMPCLEDAAGEKTGNGINICYNPEFVALGNVIDGFLRPDLVVIGEQNSYAGDAVSEIHNILCDNQPYLARMSLISAEITKIVLNVFLTVKISYANTAVLNMRF